MPNDDFLKQFQEAPPDDFAQDLLAQLKHNDRQVVGKPVIDVTNDNHKQALRLVTSPVQRRQRPKDRYITAIASFIVLILFSSILVVNVGNQSTTVDTARTTTSISTDDIAQLIWSPRGDALYVADAMYLYQLDGHLDVRYSLPLNLTGAVTALEFIDSASILVIGDASGTITLVDILTQTILDQQQIHDSQIQVMRWITDHDYLISASQAGDLLVLDWQDDTFIEQDRMSITHYATPMFITGLAIHPNGRHMIATMNNSATFMYQLGIDGTLAMSDDESSVSSLPPTLQTHFRLNGERIMYVWWDNLVVLDSHTLSERYRYALPDQYQWLHPLQMSDDGLRVLLSDNRNQIALWDFSKEIYIPIMDDLNISNPVTHSVLHPNGQQVAVILPSKEIHLWQVTETANDELQVLEVAVNRLGVSQQIMFDVSATLAPITINEADRLVELFSFGDGFLTQALWSPDGSKLIVTSTSTIRVYTPDLQLRREWSLNGTDTVKASFTRDGQYLVTASSTGTISVWNVITGQLLSSLSDIHQGAVTTLTVIDTQNRIISRDETGEFVLLSFDGTRLFIVDRFVSGALADYRILDWHLDDDLLRFVMMRQIALGSGTELVNIVDFDLSTAFEANTTTTAIAGRFSTFTADASQLLVYDNDVNHIDIYDSRTFDLQNRITVPASFGSAIHVQRDLLTKQILLIDYDNELYRYDHEQGEVYQIQEADVLFDEPANNIALHPDGEQIALIASYNHIVVGRIDETNRGYFLTQIADDTPVVGQIQTFITSTQNIAAASTVDGAVLLFDTITGTLLSRVSLSTQGTQNHDLAFDPSGEKLVVIGQSISGSDSIVNILDVQAAISGADTVHLSQSPYHFPNEYISGLAFDATGSHFITGGSRVREWTVNIDYFRIEDAKNLSGLMIFDYHPQLPEVATLRPGNYLRVINTYNMNYQYSNRITNRSNMVGTFLHYTNDAETIILGSTGESIEFYDAESGDLQLTLDGLPDQAFTDITLSHDGQTLFASSDMGVFAWELDAIRAGDTMARSLQIDFAVQQIALSADSLRLFLVGDDGKIRVMGIP